MIKKNMLSSGQSLVPGIYGGVGPLAHIKFEEALIRECNKRGINKDQEYPVWLLVNGSSTPDRTRSIKGEANSLEHLLFFSQMLQNQGADFIVITCNTAHYYQKDIEKKIDIPIISLINETAGSIAKNHPLSEKVGLIATDGTVNSGIYQKALEVYGIATILPESLTQKKVMDCIYHPRYGIKSTGTKVTSEAIDILKKVADELLSKGAETIIAGCTEISIGLSEKEFANVDVTNPIEIVSKKVIEKCFSQIEILRPKETKTDANIKLGSDFKYDFLHKEHE